MTDATLGVAEATISLSRRPSTKGRLKALPITNDVSADVSVELNAALRKLILDSPTNTAQNEHSANDASSSRNRDIPQINIPLTPTDNVCADFVFSTPKVKRRKPSDTKDIENMGNEVTAEEPVVKVIQKVSRKLTRRLTSSNLRPLMEDPRRGRVFKLENFNWMKTIGTGTFGRVVLCEDTSAKPNQEPKYFAMKILRIRDVFKLKQVEHIKDEKHILEMVDHPFIVKLFWSYHDNTNLYMLLEYAPGGELFTYLRSVGRFPSPTAIFYAAEILLALEYLHLKSIVYRDLKPENLIFDQKGHVRITDFGFAKELTDRTWTLCGTPEYLAPEIIQSRGYNKAVDYWAYGILIYEMLAGHPPFYSDNPIEVYQKILDGKIRWPKNFDLIAKDLIKKLLVADRTKRLGSMKSGVDDIKAHRWFWTINWQSCLDKEIEVFRDKKETLYAEAAMKVYLRKTPAAGGDERKEAKKHDSCQVKSRGLPDMRRREKACEYLSVRIVQIVPDCAKHALGKGFLSSTGSVLSKEDPPYGPNVAHPGDAGNFDDYPEDWLDDPGAPALPEQVAVFQDF